MRQLLPVWRTTRSKEKPQTYKVETIQPLLDLWRPEQERKRNRIRKSCDRETSRLKRQARDVTYE
jgi:hypothetical protein